MTEDDWREFDPPEPWWSIIAILLLLSGAILIINGVFGP